MQRATPYSRRRPTATLRLVVTGALLQCLTPACRRAYEECYVPEPRTFPSGYYYYYVDDSEPNHDTSDTGSVDDFRLSIRRATMLIDGDVAVATLWLDTGTKYVIRYEVTDRRMRRQ